MLASSCGNDAAPSATSTEPTNVLDRAQSDPGWVGNLEGTNAFVAVVAGGGEVVAYVCDGDAGIAEWFTGVIDDDGSFTLTSGTGAAMSGDVGERAIEGSIELGDAIPHRFSLDPAETGAGLYRVVDPDADRDGVSAGWIIDNTGAQRGSLRTGRSNRAAPALPRSDLVVNGSRYSVVVYALPDVSSRPGAPAPVPIPYPLADSGR